MSFALGSIGSIGLATAQANEATLATAAAATAAAKASQANPTACPADLNAVASDDCIREWYKQSECDGTGTFVAEDPFFSTRAGWALNPALKQDITRGIPNATQKNISHTLQLWQWYRRVAPESAQAKRCSSTPYWPRMMEKAAPNSRPLNEEYKVRDVNSGSPVVYSSDAAAIKACQTAPQRGLYPANNPAGLFGYVFLHDQNQQQGFCSAVWRAAGGQGQALFDPRIRGARSSAFPDQYSFFPKVCWNGPGEQPCEMPVNMIGVGSNFTGQGLYWQQGAYDGNTKMPSGDGFHNARAACINDPNCSGVWRSWTGYAAVPYLYDPRVTSPTELATGNELFTQPFYNMAPGPWYSGVGGYATPNPSMFGPVPSNFGYPQAGIASASVFSQNLPPTSLLSGDATTQYQTARDAQTAASTATRAAEQAVIDATNNYAAAVKAGVATDIAAKQQILQTKIVEAQSKAAIETAAIATTTTLINGWISTTSSAMGVQAKLGTAGTNCNWWAPQSGVQPAVTGGESYADAAAAGKACADGGANCVGVWQSDSGGNFFIVKTTAMPGDYLHPLISGKGIFWRKSCPAAEVAAANAYTQGEVDKKAQADKVDKEKALTEQAQAAASEAARVQKLTEDAKAAAAAAYKALQDKLDAANVTAAQTTKDMAAIQKEKTDLTGLNKSYTDQLVQMKQISDALTAARDNAVTSREAAMKQLNASSGACSVM